MLFKGTATRPPGYVERDVEGVGGRINAGTSWDYTFYHTVLPASRATAGIEMLADVAVNASLDATLLEAEKQVVLEEMRLNEDTPQRFLVRQLFLSSFEGHPYGRPVIGRPELVTALSRETLLGFYRRHYGPEAFALVVVGAVNPEQVLRVARATRWAACREAAADGCRRRPRRPRRRCAWSSRVPAARRTWAWPGRRRDSTTPRRPRSTCSCPSWPAGAGRRGWSPRCGRGRVS
jgi:hypothetical protein